MSIKTEREIADTHKCHGTAIMLTRIEGHQFDESSPLLYWTMTLGPAEGGCRFILEWRPYCGEKLAGTLERSESDD